MTDRQTIGVAVYCKCGGIIYCCTDECYWQRGGEGHVTSFFNKGFRIGRVSSETVGRLFGCKCETK